ncbi:uncharacterized protein BXIN_1363 [Babesia sp. Xinjiang]|uniref:uncharacterized protein n=1 Tax=Babesia sp. Xinjiang TaxID=462227 RepID=UPI000A218A00|nr:uncharacterized protein BXIN_1363 [Babesia sp. Xinjiang]ORM40219.1 hypothetical protein BXIN_1363 [Babesia sp. Xinjiang]
MEELASIAAGGLSPEEARRVREQQSQRLSEKIERRRAYVKKTMKTLRHYKVVIAARLEKRQAQMLEWKNEVDMVMADYRADCRKLAEEDAKELHEFYLWAKDEIVKCAKTAAERAPVEDNSAILRAINTMLKNC